MMSILPATSVMVFEIFLSCGVNKCLIVCSVSDIAIEVVIRYT